MRRVPRFFCDDHLRRLARWLRAAGYDTAWEASISDAELLTRCRAEDRILLTLDHRLAAAAAGQGCLLPSHDPVLQLRHLRHRFALDLLSHAFTRCPVCNVPTELAQEVEVPPRVRELCAEFWRCPSCARVYWHGDHVRHMTERFSAAQRG